MQTPAEAAYALLNTPPPDNDAEATQRRDDVCRLLEATPAATATLALRERALACVSWLRLGRGDRAGPYLDYDWRAAPPALCGLVGTALLSVGAVAPAVALLKHAVTDPEVDAALQVNAGRALALTGELEPALALLLQAHRALGPDHTLASQSLCEVLLALGRFADALDLVPENLNNESLALSRAQVLAAAGDHDSAAEWLRRVCEATPRSIPPRLLASEIALLRGRNSEAQRLLTQALLIAPDDISLLTQMAATVRRMVDDPKAVAAVERAMALVEQGEYPPPLRARVLTARAQLHWNAEQSEASEDCLYRALALDPQCIPALSQRGHALLERGRVEQAIECFNQIQAIAPLQGWRQLMQANRLPDDPQVLEALEKEARMPSLEGPVRGSLLFTLAGAYDKAKAYERAMQVAIEANEAIKARLGYDPVAHRRRVEAELRSFSAELMAARQGWGLASELPVFVLGMPRSGTTLTEQLLAGHSQVHGAGELSQIPAVIARIEAWQRHLGSPLPYPHCVRELDAGYCQSLASQLLEALQALAPTARRIVDKLPHNFENIGLIKLLFPNARIVHVRREPRDIATSNYFTDYAARFGGMGFAYDLGWIGEQLVDHDRLMAHWHALFPGQILEVRYESLVEDTEAGARRMIEFLGLAWEPGVLAHQDVDRPVRTASILQVRQPVYQTSKARWKRYGDVFGALEAALARAPEPVPPWPLSAHPPGLFEQGMRQLQSRQPVEAEASLAQLVAAYPRHAAAHQFLGVALLEQGKAEQAQVQMRQSLALHRGHASWYENLARAELALGRVERANEAVLAARKLRERNGGSALTTQTD